MGRKSRNKRMRKVLRPAVAPADNPGRRSVAKPASGAKAKVKRLLEAMVDAAYEDLASGVEKPRVSYGQALRAGELLVRYEEADEEDAAEDAAVEGTDEYAVETQTGELDAWQGQPADATRTAEFESEVSGAPVTG